MPEDEHFAALPPAVQDHVVAGLHGPAEIVVDRWGIPHIRATTRRDVFFVQGFNAARDRLWQIDLWRKRGLGRLAADFGPGFLAQDRAARLFLYRPDAYRPDAGPGLGRAEWHAYGTREARSITESFAAGINAYIALTEREPERLAPEFVAMGTRPARWEPADVLRIRSHGLTRNVGSEVARARVMARLGLDADLARRSLDPPWTPIVPDGLDAAAIPADVLDAFSLATVAVDFPPARLAATLADAWRWAKVGDLGDVYLQGSNNWAIAGSRTATGRPILASDPHRAHALPSLRYIVHLSGPDIDVIGTGEPAIPGISFGHNGHAAFALTIFPVDQEDLYVYETAPDDPELYRYGDGWERMRTVRETIEVKGAPAQDVVLKFTRHGPVIYEDSPRRRAYAVRSVWAEPGASAYYASLATMQAKSPTQYETALQHWATPSLNHVYADVDGNIAWFAAGRVPVRSNWDGLLPVPGDGRYEWAGFYPRGDFPKSVNPDAGFVHSANAMNLPPDFPINERRFGFEWSERSRHDRIAAVLAEQPQHSLADSMALQTDDVSLPARRILAVLAPFAAEGTAGSALSLLHGWDARLGRDSGAALLFEVWWACHLKPAMLDLLCPDAIVRPLMAPGDHETLLAMLEGADARLGDRDGLLHRTLAAAWADCAARFGADPAGWAWGRLHLGYFEHALHRLHADLPDVGPLAKGGSGSTVMNASYRTTDFRVTAGASFRMVLDVGAWDNSVAINAPGQSGDPRSPHYADLARLWASGQYVPLLYTRPAVDAAASLVIRLTPP